MVRGLLEILLPFLLELFVLDAAKGGGVDLHSTHFRLQGLVDQILDLLALHSTSFSKPNC
jgi:hypothetical protein